MEKPASWTEKPFNLHWINEAICAIEFAGKEHTFVSLLIWLVSIDFGFCKCRACQVAAVANGA